MLANVRPSPHPGGLSRGPPWLSVFPSPLPSQRWKCKLIARYEERGSYRKPGSWANCDELETPYRGKNWYGVSSFVAVRPTPGCPGFRYDSRSSYLANKVFSQSTVLGFTTRKKSGSLRFLVQLNPFSDFTQEIASFGLSSRNWIFLSLPAGLRKLKRRTSAGCFSSATGTTSALAPYTSLRALC